MQRDAKNPALMAGHGLQTSQGRGLFDLGLLVYSPRYTAG